MFLYYLCHKDQDQCTQSPLIGAFLAFLAFLASYKTFKSGVQHVLIGDVSWPAGELAVLARGDISILEAIYPLVMQ